MKIIYRIFVGLSIVLLSLGLYLGFQIQKGNLGSKDSTQITEKKEKQEENIEIPKVPRSSAFNGNDPLHILVLGIDRTELAGEENGEDTARSDTIMLATLDPVAKRAQLISIPRDTYVNVPGHGKTKINHAFAYGGMALTKKTVEQFMDISIDFYAIVDYDAVRELTTAVGGVEVYMPVDYKYSDTSVVPPLHIDFKKGYHLVEGDDAVRYLRIRKAYDNQDISRIGQQQKFLMSLFQKTKQPKMLLKLPTLINIVNKDVETNLTYGQIADLAYFGLSLEPGDIQTTYLEGGGYRIDGLDYWVVNQRYARNLITDFIREGRPDDPGVSETVDDTEENTMNFTENNKIQNGESEVNLETESDS